MKVESESTSTLISDFFFCVLCDSVEDLWVVLAAVFGLPTDSPEKLPQVFPLFSVFTFRKNDNEKKGYSLEIQRVVSVFTFCKNDTKRKEIRLKFKKLFQFLNFSKMIRRERILSKNSKRSFHSHRFYIWKKQRRKRIIA